MIVDIVKRNVFGSGELEIAFAVNAEGINDSGFAGQVCQWWPGLANVGPTILGSALSEFRGGVRFHAVCCHSLGRSGWTGAPAHILSALDSIKTINPIAVVLMGNGPVGQMQGADVMANLSAIARSQKRCVVYYL